MKSYVYKVIQINGEGDITSSMITESEWIALSEFSLKNKISIANDELDPKAIITQKNFIKNVDNYIFMDAATVSQKTQKVMFSTELKTYERVGQEVKSGFSNFTLKKYTTEHYNIALEKVTSNLYLLSGGDIRIAKIIAVLASKDKGNKLWKTMAASNQGMELEN